MKQKHFFIGIGIVAEGIPNKDDDDETTTRTKALEVKSISAAQTKMLWKLRLRTTRMGFDIGRMERVVCFFYLCGSSFRTWKEALLLDIFRQA